MTIAGSDRVVLDADPDDRPWRPASSGPSFVYVIPCIGEDILKLGMSRDPLERFQTLHPRYFDFFDFDAGFLIQTDTVREARSIEMLLGRQIALHRAPAPLTVSHNAGGDTEWYRGALRHLTRAAVEHGQLGYTVHRPMVSWMQGAMKNRGSQLFHWSAQMLDVIEQQRGPFPASSPPTPLERTLRNALEAFTAFELPFEGLVPDAVVRWYGGRP